MSDETGLLIEAAERYASIWNDEEDRFNIKNAFFQGHKYAKKIKWQDISTAPKDRRILVYNTMTGIYITQYENGDWPLFGCEYDLKTCWVPIHYSHPTHWQELPEAPKEKK